MARQPSRRLHRHVVVAPARREQEGHSCESGLPRNPKVESTHNAGHFEDLAGPGLLQSTTAEQRRRSKIQW